jgi:hypothetical protein
MEADMFRRCLSVLVVTLAAVEVSVAQDVSLGFNSLADDAALVGSEPLENPVVTQLQYSPEVVFTANDTGRRRRSRKGRRGKTRPTIVLPPEPSWTTGAYFGAGHFRVNSGPFENLLEDGIRTTIGVRRKVWEGSTPDSGVLIELGFSHTYLEGSHNGQINQPGGFQGELESMNMYEGLFGAMYDFGRIDRLRLIGAPHFRVGARTRIGAAETDLDPVLFNPAKPQVLVVDPEQHSMLVAGELVNSLTWRVWGGDLEAELAYGVLGSQTLSTGSGDSAHEYASLMLQYTIFLDGYESGNTSAWSW